MSGDGSKRNECATMKHLLKWLRHRRQRRRARNNCFSSSVEEGEDDDDKEEQVAPISFDLPTIAIHSLSEHDPAAIIIASNATLRTEPFETTMTTTENQNNNNLPLLYSLAKSWAWQAVWFRCRTHPQEASAEYVNENGDTVLHWAVFGNPTQEVVGELLKACPQLARKPNNEGQYPLHVASSYRASATVIKLILDSYPDAAGLPTINGSYALHLMCDYGATTSALYHILETSAGVATVTREDFIYKRRPLHILNGRKNMASCQRARDSMRSLRQKIRTLETVNADGNKNEIGRFKQALMEYANDDMWRKACMLLVAEAYQRPISDGDLEPGKVLRAAIQIEDCPASFSERAILLYSETLMDPGINGCVPLHIAAERGNTSLILDLLQACPEAAAVRSPTGSLPLQTLLGQSQSQQWNDGIGALVEAYPQALEELHLPDAVYPLIWRKLSSRESLFQAVRACPRNFAKGSDR